jgi:hypothetical protein
MRLLLVEDELEIPAVSKVFPYRSWLSGRRCRGCEKRDEMCGREHLRHLDRGPSTMTACIGNQCRYLWSAMHACIADAWAEAGDLRLR